MPWLSKTMKDVISCDKPRGGANNCLIRGFPNGETHTAEGCVSALGGSKPRELKHLSTWRKRKQIVIPLVVAIETGRAQTMIV